MLLWGIPCRRVEKELRQAFPDDPVPNYSTISRWLRYDPKSRTDLARWCTVLEQTAELITSRLNAMSIDQLITFYERSNTVMQQTYDRMITQDATPPRTKSKSRRRQAAQCPQARLGDQRLSHLTTEAGNKVNHASPHEILQKTTRYPRSPSR
jgi:hypothetical protein